MLSAVCCTREPHALHSDDHAPQVAPDEDRDPANLHELHPTKTATQQVFTNFASPKPALQLSMPFWQALGQRVFDYHVVIWCMQAGGRVI